MSVRLTEDQEALQTSFGRFFAAEATMDRVRSAEPLGFDEDLWRKLTELGVVAMAVPSSPDVEDGGARLLDFAVVCEEQGRRLAPVPLVEAVVAARLLSQVATASTVQRMLGDDALATVALRPVEAAVSRLVPGGAIADAVIGLDHDRLVVARRSHDDRTVPPATLGCTSAADRMFGDDVAVLAQGIRAHRCYAVAKDEWLVLTASSLVGLARGALDLGVGYVTERRQFDRPIGSFQSVAHRLADAATRVDGARLLAQEAAYAGDQRTDSASTLASMAFAFAAETARAVTTEALHFHGGYGYMMEYDIQMYFRRAMALALLAGGVGASYQRVVESLRRTDDLPIRLETSVQAEAFRKEARAFVEEHVTPEICEVAHQSGTYHCWELHRALGEQGWLAGAWPLDEGGQGRDSLDMLVLQEELQRVAAPVDGWSVTWSAAEAIRAFGSPALKAAVLPDVLAGKRLIALGFSEPDAGSDVAAARTRAVQDGDAWIINGQKMFTTLAHESDWVFLLARTNLAAAKHRGLTLFLVPTSAAGLSLHPVHTLGGERTNITFFNDVCVPDELRVGEIDAGWAVLTRALNVERGSAVGPGPVFLGTLRYMVTTAMRWARGDRLQSPLEMDGRVGDLLARACIQLAVSELLIRRGVVTTSQHPDVEAAMSKLFITEAIQALAPPLLDMCGADGLLDSGAANAPGDGELERLFRHSVVTTIYGGSSEIMREIIGRRRLNLPI